MTTIRSHFSFEQFEQVLQKLAHEEAIEAATELQDVKLTIRSGRIREIETDNAHIRFFASHMTYYVQGSPVKKIDERWRECPKCEYGWTTATHCPTCGEETQPTYRTTYPDALGFDVEQKLYMTSNHRTKISLLGEDDKIERTKEFIDKIMADQEAKPRFTLSQVQ